MCTPSQHTISLSGTARQLSAKRVGSQPTEVFQQLDHDDSSSRAISVSDNQTNPGTRASALNKPEHKAAVAIKTMQPAGSQPGPNFIHRTTKLRCCRSYIFNRILLALESTATWIEREQFYMHGPVTGDCSTVARRHQPQPDIGFIGQSQQTGPPARSNSPSICRRNRFRTNLSPRLWERPPPD